MEKIGIIPVGGKATRWEGFPKEILPLGSSWTLLDRMLLLQTRALVDHVILVSSEEKYDFHKWYIQDHRKWPDTTITTADSVMNAIKSSISKYPKADWIFSFPDTYTDMPLFPEELTDPLEIGLFKTDKPEKFGMFRYMTPTESEIIDKQPGVPGRAYGAFMFNRDVAKFWLDNEFDDHTHMLNRALKEFNWGSWPIEMYFDIATFGDYLSLLGGIYNAKK